MGRGIPFLFFSFSTRFFFSLYFPQHSPIIIGFSFEFDLFFWLKLNLTIIIILILKPKKQKWK